MNAPAFPKDSGVTDCQTCDGTGSVSNGRGLGGNDPDSWSVECEDCEGVGHFACEVCGFNQRVTGFDCLACDALVGVLVADLQKIDKSALCTAMGHAFDAALAAIAKAKGLAQ